MQLVVISPEGEDAREVPAMGGLFAAGLERYHVRKPGWSREYMEGWLAALPRAWRGGLVLHQHHDLAAAFGLAGVHERDEGEPRGGLSRSCHDLAALGRCLPLYRSLFFAPVFPSLSKPGRGPAADMRWDELTRVLGRRPAADARVLALGGVTQERLARCLDLGFDGAAVLGAVWKDRDPVAGFVRIRDAASHLEGARHAA